MKRVDRHTQCERCVRRLTKRFLDVRYPEAVCHLIELFYSEHCPGCPEARHLLQRFAAERQDVVAIERNIADDGDYQLATDYHLIATPAWVIDRHNVLYGVPKSRNLAARVAASAPALS